MRRAWIFMLMVLAMPAVLLAADRFPPPQFKTPHQVPETQVPPVRWAGWTYIDVAVFAAMLGLAAWFIIHKRWRRGVLALTILSVVYLGFWRKGCICAVGSVQNVTLAAFDSSYALPWVAAAMFLLPLLATLLYGRIFCGGVCPLGAIQDLVVWKPVQVPAWLESALGLLAYAYLGLAVLYAATGSDFVICRYDPFVGFFRLSGPSHMIWIGAVLLVTGLFVGRVYCRFLCPYGVLLRLLAPFSRHKVTITPAQCIDCRLCQAACPFGAIHAPTPQRKPGTRQEGRERLVATVALVPAIVAVMAFAGYLAGPVLSRADFTVKLAEQEWKAQQQPTPAAGVAPKPLPDEVKAFRGTTDTPRELFKRADAIQHKFRIGGTLFGVWMGLVVGLKLVGLAVRRRRSEWVADAGACVSCARCYLSCPVEHERRQLQRAEAVEVLG